MSPSLKKIDDIINNGYYILTTSNIESSCDKLIQSNNLKSPYVLKKEDLYGMVYCIDTKTSIRQEIINVCSPKFRTVVVDSIEDLDSIEPSNDFITLEIQNDMYNNLLIRKRIDDLSKICNIEKIKSLDKKEKQEHISNTCSIKVIDVIHDYINEYEFKSEDIKNDTIKMLDEILYI
jgi:hypothetical protein